MQANLALDADIYIPGHGELLSKDTLMNWVKAFEERRDQIKAMFDQGKTLDEIKATLNDVPLKGMAARFLTFIETTYKELTAEKSSACVSFSLPGAWNSPRGGNLSSRAPLVSLWRAVEWLPNDRGGAAR